MAIQGLDTRLKEVRKELGLNQQQLAEVLNLTSATVSNVESGNGDLTAGSFNRLVENYGVNINWLLTGKGEMFGGGNVTQSIENVSNKLGVANVSNNHNGGLDKVHELELENATLKGRLQEKDSMLQMFINTLNKK